MIDFLLGGKKKTKVPRNAQVTGPVGSATSGEQATPDAGGGAPDGVSNPTQNAAAPNEKSAADKQAAPSSKPATPTPGASSSPQGGKKSISEVIGRIHKEIKNTNESVVNLVGEIKQVKNNISTIEQRVNELEGGSKENTDKIGEIDENMGKFLSLYELVNNQYNPFVESGNQPLPQKEIVLDSNGDSSSEKKDSDSQDDIKKKFKEIEINKEDGSKNGAEHEDNDFDSAFLDLDTLNIEEAAGDAIPLTKLKGTTNSLVTILSWLEYLVKKVGLEETKNTLRYYTETLKWITPEVYFELDKYLKGMTDIEVNENKRLNVRDHIVSLYFISKLNETSLDRKLTKAVLQIIKE